MTVDIAAQSIWSERIDRMRSRARGQLTNLGLSDKKQKALTRLTLQLITDTNAKIAAKARTADQYTRPMPRTLWSEKFDQSRSPINLPITGQLLRVYATALKVPKPWSVGYLMALATLDLFEQLSRSNISDTAAYRALDNVFEREEEMYTFVESMLGKAEEAVYKADILSEQARHGERSKRPQEKSWEKRVKEELVNMGQRIDELRFKSGKKIGQINKTKLALRLLALINSVNRPLHFPLSEKTIQRRLPKLLAELNIPDK